MSLSLGDNKLNFTDTFKYLSHIITDDLSDDIDLKREIRNI
jgi:hypothetical protein